MSRHKFISFDLLSIGKINTAEQASQLAIKWQNWQSEHSLSYGEMVYYQNYFEELAKEFNLTEEFKENAII